MRSLLCLNASSPSLAAPLVCGWVLRSFRIVGSRQQRLCRRVRSVAEQQPQVTDDRLDEVILGGLRIMREGLRQGAWNNSTMTVAGIAAMVDQPEARVQTRVADLAARGLIKESEAAPGRWTIAG